jgi:hypothetical protein
MTQKRPWDEKFLQKILQRFAALQPFLQPDSRASYPRVTAHVAGFAPLHVIGFLQANAAQGYSKAQREAPSREAQGAAKG